MSKPSVPEYFAGKHVLITGATGFIGKVLIEKLLRCCPGVERIYCLIRPQKGLSARERLQNLLEGKLYDRLRQDQPSFEEKVTAVHGDITENGLGLRQDDCSVLEQKINVVFHSAATVRFDEQLRLATELNVLGVQRMLKVCRKFQHLEVFLHVSSAYANCDRKYIEEIVYPPPIEPWKLIDALDWMDDEMVELVKDKIVHPKPNTYTYTKQMAECLLVQEAGDIPLCIVRPSIVSAAWKEPFPGWIDSWNGPSGLYIAAGKGILRSMKANSHTVADLIPVDLPVNLMVASAWHTAVYKPKIKEAIYHITTGSINPFTWGEMESVVMNYFKRNPLDACYRRPKCNITSSSMMHDYWVLVSHMIPAYAVDLAYLLAGKKPRMVQIYNKLHKAMGTLEYFTVRSWEWTYHNTDTLKNALTSEDEKTFFFDPRELHWPTYIENYCLGTKTFILKEDPSGLPAARAHLKKLRNIRYTFNTALLVILWRLLIARSQLARNSWYLITGLIFKFVRFFRITSSISS